MKKKLIIIIAFVFILSACNKEDSVNNKINNGNTSLNGGNKLKWGEDLNKEELIEIIQTFQQNRNNYWKSGTSPDYTQTQALFQIPLILNFELAGYGYLSEIENIDLEISITNNGTNESGDIILLGEDMFVKYRDVEEYIKTQLGEKKLFYANIKIKETLENNTIFNISISYGTLSESPGNNRVYYDFPVIPIGQTINCWVFGSPDYVANEMTKAFNPMPVDYCYDRRANLILVDVFPPLQYHWISPDPGDPNSYFLYHNCCPYNISSTPYRIPYSNWANAIRYAAPSYIFATHINVYYDDNAIGFGGQYYYYQVCHNMNVWFAKWEFLPELFNNNGPIIPEI